MIIRRAFGNTISDQLNINVQSLEEVETVLKSVKLSFDVLTAESFTSESIRMLVQNIRKRWNDQSDATTRQQVRHWAYSNSISLNCMHAWQFLWNHFTEVAQGRHAAGDTFHILDCIPERAFWHFNGSSRVTCSSWYMLNRRYVCLI